MPASRRRFQPAPWATAGTVLLCAVLFAAGFWQLGRAAEKRALLESYGQAIETAPADFTHHEVDLQRERYRPVRLRGRYDSAHQVLLDARIRDRRAGYEVLTPFDTAQGTVLVNRGWVPAAADRNQLPDVAVDAADRQLVGILDRLPAPALRAGAPVPASAGTTWPRRMLYPTADEIRAALGRPVADFQLLLSPDTPDGYLRDWRPKMLSPRQHLGYAVQWFALGGALVVIYVTLNFRKASRLQA